MMSGLGFALVNPKLTYYTTNNSNMPFWYNSSAVFIFSVLLVSVLHHCQGKSDDGSDTADDALSGSNKRTSRSFMESFSKRKVAYLNDMLKISYHANWMTHRLILFTEKDDKNEEDVEF